MWVWKSVRDRVSVNARISVSVRVRIRVRGSPMGRVGIMCSVMARIMVSE